MKIPAIPTRILRLHSSDLIDPGNLAFLYRDSYKGDILPIHNKLNMADRM